MLAAVDDLMYDKNNLRETIRYCRTHNHLLRDFTEEEIETRFWNEIRRTVGTLRTSNLRAYEGRLERVYDAWFVIDPARGQFVSTAIENSPHGTHVITFFVRMGRLPAIDEVR